MALIGIVLSWVEERKLTVNQDYVEAVLRAGGTPVLFSRDIRPEVALHAAGQGGRITTHRRCGCESCRIRRTEKNLLRKLFRPQGLNGIPPLPGGHKPPVPVFAICRGMQVLSCVLGGNLYQDLSEQFGAALQHPRYDMPGDPVHTVDLKADTLLFSIVGVSSLNVNSRHHQGIKNAGTGLKVCASAPDGLVEGVELPGYPFVLGVQWHPESLSDRYPEHQKLFTAFVNASHGNSSC